MSALIYAVVALGVLAIAAAVAAVVWSLLPPPVTPTPRKSDALDDLMRRNGF